MIRSGSCLRGTAARTGAPLSGESEPEAAGTRSWRGGISSDEAGFGLGPLLDPELIRSRIAAAYAGEEVVT